MPPRPRLAWLIVFAGLAILHTWPLARAPHVLSLVHNADTELNAWIVSWIAHVLPTAPWDFWRGNIFQPGELALTFSEPLLIPALLGAPIFWTTGSAILTFNVLLLAGLALTGVMTMWVVRREVSSTFAAVLAGMFAAFNAHLLTRLPHLQAAHAWGLPLVWGATWARLHGHGRAWWLPVAVALTAATSLHWLVFAVIGAGLMAVVTRHPVTHLLRVVIEGAAGVVLALPVLWPHLSGGVVRPLEQVADFAATPAGWVTSLSHAHAWWSRAWFTVDTNVWFPGVVIVVLAGCGLFVSWRTRPLARWAVLMVVAGVVLSLGPAAPVYEWLYRVFPPMQGIRAATRFGALAYGGLTLLAAYGAVWMLERMQRPALAAALIGVLLTAEQLHAPITTTPWSGVPAVYSLLRDEPGPVLLVEMPFYPPDAVFENGEYVLNATGHWRNVANGYSGLTPMSYRRYTETLWYFPEERAWPTLNQMGATHVMVHLRKFGGDAAAVESALQTRPDLRLMAADRDGRRLYRLVRE